MFFVNFFKTYDGLQKFFFFKIDSLFLDPAISPPNNTISDNYSTILFLHSF